MCVLVYHCQLYKTFIVVARSLLCTYLINFSTSVVLETMCMNLFLTQLIFLRCYSYIDIIATNKCSVKKGMCFLFPHFILDLNKKRNIQFFSLGGAELLQSRARSPSVLPPGAQATLSPPAERRAHMPV